MPRRKRSRILVITVIIITLAAVGAWYFIILREKDTQITYTDSDGITYESATEEERSETERHKDSIAEQEDRVKETEDKPSDETKARVYPVITSWGQSSAGADFTVNGYVPQVIETDGACSIIFERDGTNATVEKAAFFNAQSTSCGQLTMPFSKIGAGEWKVTLQYESPNSRGSSEPMVVEVK